MNAKMEAGALAYRMRPKSSREIEGFKSYSLAKLQLWLQFVVVVFSITDPGR